ncbi:oxygen-independent coproporphyrinogen-3 oxidase [Nitrosomonas oligotropha]|uniref:Heme chaperone HemW n=1 Tax=Nitrosomonas oligotropha TaxID=42354 RepID=A0A2T5HZD1_9PROT|nr:radical SAM family heme chaperone HemW [Nitrosomonas oligotropha]PTQ76930.1 oxygen-independent coproporphyrinogen-3 oxidase [Nitrosomonas oligotropha]
MSDLPVPKLKALPPLSLYIHIPWCLKKCPYCDFNSHEIRGQDNQTPEDEYVAALIRDLELALADVWGRRLSSVFFGGGTPSLFSARSIDTILTAVRTLLPLEHFAEVTLEANPGTFETQKFADFRAAGINRLSIGIQSFNPQHLKALGRVHDDQEAHRAVEIAQKNFDNINLDLMYALPGQTLPEAQNDIETACAAGVTHISAYHLTLEPNTLFHRFPPALPDDEQAAAMQEMIEQVTAKQQYRNYETSAFARAGKESRHNMNYWQFGDYLGIGAGAHSKISFADKIVRQMRYKQPKEYLAKAQSGESLVHTHQEVTAEDRGFEFMMNALRLNGGFDTSLFQERTGLPLSVVRQQLDEAEQRGLLVHDHLRIKPTILGRRFLNDLLQIFLPEKNSAG